MYYNKWKIQILIQNIYYQKNHQYFISNLVILQEAFYQLHQNNIMGRVFSTSNILDTKNGLVLLDFGFGPKFQSDEEFRILPPEILGELKQQNYANYDLQLDSWLVGAFLYNICKLCPINKICQKERLQYQEWILEQCNKKNITFKTNRYSYEFRLFVEGLLTFDKQKRLTFTWIQKTNLFKVQKQEIFYKGLICMRNQKTMS